MLFDVGMGFPLFLTMGFGFPSTSSGQAYQPPLLLSFPSTGFGYTQPNIASFLRQALRFPLIGSTHLV